MPEKLEMRTKNITDEKIDKIADLFPNCITESLKDGKIIRSVDFDALKQELSDFVVDGPVERYQFTWPDKSKAKLLANTPINMTLRPCPEESVDFDNTKNLYIEGDNLDVLKLLRETYLGKVKIIYIDPPYNTGNDFVYEDDFKMSADKYSEISGYYDDIGNRMEINTSSNGRFHTDWLNMLYSRLVISRDLLTTDGVIFISIDDGEVGNLRKMCDEVFGETNFVNQIIWHKKYGAANDSQYLSDVHDYILLYCKDKKSWRPNLFDRPAELNGKYKNPDNDPRGPWIATNLSVKTYSAANDYVITSPAGLSFSPPPSRCWVVSKEKYVELLDDGRIFFGLDGRSRPYKKTFLSEVQDGIVPTTVWSYNDAGHNVGAKSELRDIFSDMRVPFDTPKPTKLIMRIIEMSESKSHDDIILDFFSGSSTTADAVIQMNAKDGGKRRYILVQIKEPTDNKSVAKIEGFNDICEIGKERIRRVGSKIKSLPQQLTLDGNIAEKDVGFRVLKLDSSNMKDVYYSPDETYQSGLDSLLDNIKEDRKPHDLIFQCMLDLGIELSASINNYKIDGKDVCDVDNGYLLACFDIDVSESVVTKIAKKKPVYVVMRDSSMSSGSTATNFEQVFKSYSPTTIRKVI